MSVLYDIADNPISSFSMSFASGEVKQFPIRADCLPSNFLRSETVSDLTVEAKLSTDVSWTNIETTPIDLTPYGITRQTFDIRITAGTVTGFTKHKFKISVRP